MPENREIFELWTIANTQWRIVSSFGGSFIEGLDYPAVFQIAEVNFIEITPAMFQKLHSLELYELKRRNQK